MQVTTLTSFHNAIKDLEFEIDFTGPEAQKAAASLRRSAILNAIGKGVAIGSLLVGGIPMALVAGASIIVTRNMDKYDKEVVAEDHIIFRLKEKYKDKKIAKMKKES